jgi:hypothetical protein
MADRQENTNSFMSIIAIVLSVAALALAWAAFNRAGEDLEDRIEREAEQLDFDTNITEEEAPAGQLPGNTPVSSPAGSPGASPGASPVISPGVSPSPLIQ